MIDPTSGMQPITGGGNDTWKCYLSPFPLWSQVSDWTTDGQPDENKENNCGPETLASILKYLTDIELPADYIHDVIAGEGYIGYFQTSWLQGFMAKYCSIHVVEHFPRTQEELTYLIWFYLHQGKPCYWLRSFSAAGASDGHFSPLIGIDPQKIIEADVGSGTARRYNYAEAQSWSKGYLAGIERMRYV